jgi:hypothetical protein
MADETYIQVASDGAGKKVKNLKLIGVVQADGTSADVYIQCTAIVDGDGRTVDLDELTGVMRALLKEVRWLRKGFGEMTENAALTIGLDDGSDNSED